MPRDKSISHERLKEAAKKEFLRLGFQNASMREIGRLAGMSQAAIYKHYKNKEEMFKALVDPLILRLEAIALEHEREAYNSFNKAPSMEFMLSNNNVEILMPLIPEYRDELRLLFLKSATTSYEGFIDRLINAEVRGTLEAISYLKRQGVRIKEISKDEIYILISSYINSMKDVIASDWDNERIFHGLKIVEEFFIPGFIKLFGIEE